MIPLQAKLEAKEKAKANRAAKKAAKAAIAAGEDPDAKQEVETGLNSYRMATGVLYSQE